jgi:hypothetical protein
MDATPLDQLQALTFSYERRKLRKARSLKFKLAHYTTADTAARILDSQTLWLRNAQLMNDFSEIAYGRKCLKDSLDAGMRGALEKALDAAYPGLFADLIDWLNNNSYNAMAHTHLMSLAEYKADDELGKLSMWRAYGGPKAGVALVFNGNALFQDSDLGVYASPVAYGDAKIFHAHLSKIAANLQRNTHLLQSIPRSDVLKVMFGAINFATLSFKHPGFAEEREWRLIHLPLTEPTAFVRQMIETVQGIPQLVCKVPLTDQPGLNAPWLNLDDLLYKVVIGPCAYSHQVAWAIQEILRKHGVSAPDKRIVISDIPLRQQV